MANVSLYIQYARIAQYESAAANRKNSVFKGGVLVPDYSRLLYILHTQIAKRFALSPSDPTLSATAEYMFSLTGVRVINTTPVTTPFIIILQPISQTVTAGANVSFSVTVAGSVPPYTYQWSLNGTPIGGAISSVIAINSVTTANAGAYTCKITDSIGEILTSIPANLVVNTATVGVFAVPVATDPFPLVSDTFTYTYNQNVVPSANIAWNLLEADNDANFWIFKEPIGNTVKLSYDNGTNLPNAGPIPDSLMREPVILGGFRYYLTRIPYSYLATQPTNLKTTS